MSIDFERTKRELSGRSILITSWFDDQNKNWQASAPAYSHVRGVISSVNPRGSSSRKVAMDQIISLLTSHFAQRESIHSESILFL